MLIIFNPIKENLHKKIAQCFYTQGYFFELHDFEKYCKIPLHLSAYFVCNNIKCRSVDIELQILLKSDKDIKKKNLRHFACFAGNPFQS